MPDFNDLYDYGYSKKKENKRRELEQKYEHLAYNKKQKVISRKMRKLFGCA